MAKFKIIFVLLPLVFFTSHFVYAQFGSGFGAGHEWKEFGYFGGHAGSYTLGDNENGYFGGVMGFYHNQLVHSHSDIWGRYVSDWGIIGSGNYFRDPETDLSLTVQYSRGLWLDRTALLQFAAGPLWSESNSWGVSSMVLLSYAFSLSDDSINAGAVFIQSDGYSSDELSGIQWRFSLGLSIGIGALNEINQ